MGTNRPRALCLFVFWLFTSLGVSCGPHAPDEGTAPNTQLTPVTPVSSLDALPLGRVEIQMQDIAGEPVTKTVSTKAQPPKYPWDLEKVERILITVREVQLIREESVLSPAAVINVGPTDTQFDLLELVDNLATLILGDTFIPVGEYHQIRLLLAEANTIVVDGKAHPLKVPSGEQTGIKLDGIFTLHGGKVTKVLLDFDVAHSVIFNKGQGYILKPVIQIASVEEAADAAVLLSQPLSERFVTEVNGQLVSYEIRDGYLVTEGDIIIGTVIDGITDVKGLLTGKGLVRTGDITWPNGVVPFTMDPALTAAQQTVVQTAMNNWMNVNVGLNLNFVPRTTETDWVTFQLGTIGCSSPVGRRGGGQVINLAAGCFNNDFVVAHEIAHALGLWHEHSREDRNNFVTINIANIIPADLHNFDQHIVNGDDINMYDFDSVMHYPPLAFAINNTQPTIVPLVPLPPGVIMGQRNHLSVGDIAAMQWLYGGDIRLIPGWFGTESQGGGIAMADLNGNGQPELLVMHIDNPPVENTGHYRVGVDCGMSGCTQWGNPIQIPGWFGTESQGADIAAADLNGNGQPELLVMHIDNPDGENTGYYRVGVDCTVAGCAQWGNPIQIPGWFGTESQGGGIGVADLNGNGSPEILIMHIDNAAGENTGHYRVGVDCNVAGCTQWGNPLLIPGWWGTEDQGAAISVVNLNGTGGPELLVAHIDNPAGENTAHYRVGFDCAITGCASWGNPIQIPGWVGTQTQGVGIAAADLNGSGQPEVFIMHIDNPAGENHGYYRVGADCEAGGACTFP
ncbi:MAG: DUF4382 domain-containing protein [Deltaproteobacteria bacterium]|nr:DUF4382 domain-containing protein [Deltaproteobacteria bacterium]